MTLIPRLEAQMFKHHMKKYQAALNGFSSGFKFKSMYIDCQL